MAHATKNRRRRLLVAAYRSALGSVLVGLLLAAPSAADVGVVGLNPAVAKPGERVELRVGCGSCPPGASFPISLVPLAQAPRSHSCRRNVLCIPAATEPPHVRPFVLLGHTGGGDALFSTPHPVGSESHLRFLTPDVAPGRYAFVIFCATCYQGPRGGLIADTSDSAELLLVQPREAPIRSGADGSEATPWVAVAAGTVALVLAVVLLVRRRRAL